MNSERMKLLQTAILNDVFITANNSFIYSSSHLSDAWIFDFRKILLQPHILDAYAELFFERFEDKYPFQVGGIEVASIPLISAIVMKSHQRQKPVNGFFTRKSRKKTGLLNMIEGQVVNLPVILVDDLINSGGSFIRQIEVLNTLKDEAKFNQLFPSTIFSILQFKPTADYTYFYEKNIKVESLFNLSEFKDILPLLTPPKNNLNKIITSKMKVLWHWKGNHPSLEYVFPKSNPIFNRNKLYVGTDNSQFICLDSTTGKIIWNYQIPSTTKRRAEFSNPVIYEDLVIFGSHDGNIYAFDTETGKRIWVSFEGDWVESSPAIAKETGLVFISLQFGYFNKHSSLCALNAKTGQLVWKFTPHQSTLLATPIYSQENNLVLVGSDQGWFYALNAKTGQLIWKREFKNQTLSTPSLDNEESIVVICGNPTKTSTDERASLTVLDVKTGTIILSTSELDYFFGTYGTPVIYKNLVIFTSLDKHIHAVNFKSGQQLWTVDTGARVFSTPSIIVIKGKARLYVGSNNSVLYEIEPETGIVTSMTYVTERITNAVTYDPNSETIFLPTYANEIYALQRETD